MEDVADVADVEATNEEAFVYLLMEFSLQQLQY